ncbi:MAG: aminoacyl-tRNA hydrolase [Hellea sp.]|nr:aminoacyl-tRNA hydrolase [Hellea sp.]
MKTDSEDNLVINDRISIPLEEMDFSAVRSQGPGGQKVNKTSSAIQLRFAIAASSLPEPVKSKLFQLRDQRLSTAGEIIIKAQSYRSQKRNREDALFRLAQLIRRQIAEQKPRRATRPTKGSVKRRLDAKSRRSRVKSQRGRVRDDD